MINLYWKLVKAGYIEFDQKKKTFVNPGEGVPQGGIVSPILSNLVLHELDLYVDKKRAELVEKSVGIKPYSPNPKYHAITNQIYRLNAKKCLTEEQKVRRRGLLTLRRTIKSILPNPDYTRIEYVRYADDWILGVWGDRNLAQNLKDGIGAFLQSLKLELSAEKTLITNARSSRAKGVHIKRLVSHNGPSLVKSTLGRKRRVATGNLIMTVPMLEIFEKMKLRGYMKPGKLFGALSVPALVGLPIKDMIIRYRTVLNGLLNYYSFADNKPQLASVF